MICPTALKSIICWRQSRQQQMLVGAVLYSKWASAALDLCHSPIAAQILNLPCNRQMFKPGSPECATRGLVYDSQIVGCFIDHGYHLTRKRLKYKR